MKKTYKWLLSIIIAVLVIVKYFPYAIAEKYPILNVVFVDLFFIPLVILLYLLANDQDISSNKRCICRIVFFFLAFCLVMSHLVELLEYIY